MVYWLCSLLQSKMTQDKGCSGSVCDLFQVGGPGQACLSQGC